MPYIGNPIYQSAFVTDQFSGTGSQTAYTMSVAPAGTTNVLVAVSGVLQDPSTYGVVGNTLNFTTAPPSGTGNISCRYLGVPVTGVTTTAYRTVTEFTATAGQTTFTPPSYSVGFINVYLNGVLLGSADYTASNGTTVVLTTGAAAGNLVTVESFQVSSVANAIPNAAGSVSSSNIVSGVTLTAPNLGTPASGVMTNVTGLPAAQLTGSQAIPKATLPTGSILQVAYTYFDGYTTSSASGIPSTITNGAQIFSISFTPVSATSQLLVQTSAIVISEEANVGDIGWLALWDGSTFICANSGTASYTHFSSNLNTGCYSLNNSYASGSTTTRTIQVRAGYNNGTAVINGNSIGYVYSGSSARVGMTIMEIAA